MTVLKRFSCDFVAYKTSHLNAFKRHTYKTEVELLKYRSWY